MTLEKIEATLKSLLKEVEKLKIATATKVLFTYEDCTIDLEEELGEVTVRDSNKQILINSSDIDALRSALVCCELYIENLIIQGKV